ncbi:uncharacterized protein V3H82_026254 [Fundulus diaphanus]
MKQGLLLLLVVVALLPYLSESRTVSKCELKEKLAAKIHLPRKLSKHTDEILSIIICEASRKSGLNTSLVNVDGMRYPMSTTEPATEETEPETMEEMAAAPTTPAATTTITAPVSSNAIATSRSSRKKRSASSREMNEPQQSLNDMENRFDEEEMAEDDERMSKEDSSSQLRDPNQMHLWSLGYYGIFQLRDSLFCDSGYRWSKNWCQKSCTDFTDDDITDDIQCFINTNYFWYFFRNLSKECFHERKTFLQDCS